MGELEQSKDMKYSSLLTKLKKQEKRIDVLERKIILIERSLRR